MGVDTAVSTKTSHSLNRFRPLMSTPVKFLQFDDHNRTPAEAITSMSLQFKSPLQMNGLSSIPVQEACNRLQHLEVMSVMPKGVSVFLF